MPENYEIMKEVCVTEVNHITIPPLMFLIIHQTDFVDVNCAHRSLIVITFN